MQKNDGINLSETFKMSVKIFDRVRKFDQGSSRVPQHIPKRSRQHVVGVALPLPLLLKNDVMCEQHHNFFFLHWIVG